MTTCERITEELSKGGFRVECSSKLDECLDGMEECRFCQQANDTTVEIVKAVATRGRQRFEFTLEYHPGQDLNELLDEALNDEPPDHIFMT